VLADTGYRGEDIFAELPDKPMDVIVSLEREGKKAAVIDSDKYPHTADMAEHLKTDSAKQAYSQRKHIVEPPAAVADFHHHFANRRLHEQYIQPYPLSFSSR